MYRQSLDVETQAVPSNNAFAAQGDSASPLELTSSGPRYDVPTRAPLPSTISKDSTRLDSRVAHHPLAVSTPLLSAKACLPIHSTISKDKTAGEDTQMSELLGRYGAWRQNTAALVGQDLSRGPTHNLDLSYPQKARTPVQDKADTTFSGLQRAPKVSIDAVDEPTLTAIMIKNIPINFRKNALLALIRNLNLPEPHLINYSDEMGGFKGLVFAEFLTAHEAALAVEGINGLKIQNRTLYVEYRSKVFWPQWFMEGPHDGEIQAAWDELRRTYGGYGN